MTNPNDALPGGLDVVSDESDQDDRVGEAVEVYMLAFEQGHPPGIDEFVARYPGLEEDIRAAIDGLEVVRGLLGLGSATGSGSGGPGGLDHRIESGQRIAGYRVVRELGRGGMGTVYEAVHVGLDRPVALKVLGVHAAPDSSARRRFLNEARTAAGLHHTHIVPVFDVGQVGGLCYYAMQRIEGSGLDRVLKHLRRARAVASGGGDAVSCSRLPSSLAADRAAAPAGNMLRVTGFWGRFPSSLRRRRTEPGRSPEQAAAAGSRSHAPGAGNEPAGRAGARLFLGPEGSTASWGTASRDASPGEGGAALAGFSVAAGPLSALSTVAPNRQRREHEPPPFDPPVGPAYFRWAAKVALEAADALAHAHERGVIHRDVKPSNLLIDAKGSIWVTDFGLARRLADPGITHHDSLLGTPRYMSPEQARTSGTIDGRTDVYSLGATLYELLTLRPPFDGRTAAELIDQIGQQEPVAPTHIDRRVPRDLETIALKALAKRPADRYATAGELFDDLGRFLNREPVKARRIGPIGRAWRVARRHPGITAVSTAAAVIVLATATFAYVKVLSERNRLATALGLLKESKRDLLLTTIEQASVSAAPKRRSNGLEKIKEAAELEQEPDRRTQLRDWAVRFLMLREIEASTAELATGRAHGLIFTPGGDQLALLSDEDDTLAFWDVRKGRQLATLPLRSGAGTFPQAVAEPGVGESAGNRPEPSGAGGSAGATSGSAPGPRSGGPGGGRRGGIPRQRLAQIGSFIAAVLPGEQGLGLLDLPSGSPLRTLKLPERNVIGLVGEPTGRRLVTIESVPGPAMVVRDERTFVVCLWDTDHFDRPITSLDWRTEAMRDGFPPYPLVAISPDARTVAVAASGRTVVKLYSAQDGKPLERSEIQPQAELSAIALGPNNLLATAGNTSGAMAIRVWDLDSRSFPTILTPNGQTNTRLMRFSPQGNLLAIMGSGPIELWDPVALNLVAALGMSDQATDMAFAPNGMTLAAIGRGGEAKLWTVHDSAVRTQLSGFDNPPASVAFGSDGVLAGVGWNGESWVWRRGRCPEIAFPAAVSTSPASAMAAAAEPKRTDSPGPDGPGRAGRTRGEGPQRPGGRGPMTPQQPSLAFDSSGRLVLNDAQGLKVYAGAARSMQGQPDFVIPIPSSLMQGPRPSRTVPLAKTPRGETMALIRGSSIYLWHAQVPDQITRVELPARFNEPSPLATLNGPSSFSSSTSATGPPRSSGPRRPPPGGREPSGPAFRSIQISPHGDRIYTTEQQRESAILRVWAIDPAAGANTARARELRAVTLPDGPNRVTALGRDGELFAVADGAGSVALFESSTLAVVGSLQDSGKPTENFPPTALVFSPDGRSLAVGSLQGTISLWSLENAAAPRLLMHLPAHRGMVTNLAYDPQGRRLASASATFADSVVEVWDLELIESELVRLKLAD